MEKSANVPGNGHAHVGVDIVEGGRTFPFIVNHQAIFLEAYFPPNLTAHKHIVLWDTEYYKVNNLCKG